MGASIMGGIGVASSAYQMIDANKRKRDAEEAIRNYKRQELVNTNAGLQVSTMGADVQREEMQRQNTDFINQLARGGTRALIGGLPQLQGGIIQQSRQIGADLDQQFVQNQQLEAQGNAMVQQMREQRENQDLAALGSERTAAMQDFGTGMNNLVSSGTAIAGNMALSDNTKAINNLAGGGMQSANPMAGTQFSSGAKVSWDPAYNLPNSWNKNNINKPGYLNTYSTYQLPKP